jgi:multicomponent Na+:H+ antiporter subunit C
VLDRLLLLLLFLIGIWGIVARKNIVKKIFGLTIINSAVVILFILEGSRIGTNTPIMSDGVTGIVDPVPQALMLTAIVIGVCITALALALAFRLHRLTGTFDIDEIRRKLHDETS